jgi:hypothetical protein
MIELDVLLLVLAIISAIHTFALRVLVYDRRRLLPYWSELAWKYGLTALLIFQGLLIGIAAAM